MAAFDENAPTMSTPPNVAPSPEPSGGPVRLKAPQSLERLRDRVQAAADELARLRRENAALAARIRDLETRPAADPDASLLILDEEPEALRRKVQGFIDAIDRYLGNEEEAETEAESSDDD